MIEEQTTRYCNRSFILTEAKVEQMKKTFAEITKGVSSKIRDMAGPNFFNPFRSGIYFSQVQALYLLGSNQYHSYNTVEKKVRQLLSQLKVKAGPAKGQTKWAAFSASCDSKGKAWKKDERGRIQYNFFLMQRFGDKSPYGYKLAQAKSCIDIQENGEILLDYRLNTCFNRVEDVKPYYTYSRKKKNTVSVVKKPHFMERKVHNPL
jgi:hypothetical protein